MSDKYPSKYSNGKFVSPAQYITELICERKAKKDGEDLHFKFWTSKKWSKFFRDQIASAHKLIDKHSHKAVIMALHTKQGQNIYSLRAPHLPSMIEEQQWVLDSQNETLTKNIDRKSDKTFGQASNISQKNNIISKLKGLDT